jgi:threonine dehydratase
MAQATGRVFVSPFDDDDIIDGNGAWLAGEILEQHAQVRRVVVPMGGGGLAGGLARALTPRGIQVIGVQPRVNCAMHDSFTQGRALTEYQGGATLCEGLEGAVSERTYELCRTYLDRIHLVDEHELPPAIALAYRIGLLVEPSAAVVFAAAPALHAEDDTVLVVTGSNIDPDRLDASLGGDGVNLSPFLAPRGEGEGREGSTCGRRELSMRSPCG